MPTANNFKLHQRVSAKTGNGVVNAFAQIAKLAGDTKEIIDKGV